MNRSGIVLPSVMRKTGATVSDILVICDTIDLEPGKLRLRRKGGTAGHNGLKSIQLFTGTDEYKRFYVGVGRPEQKSGVIQHVLSPFGNDIEKIIREAADRAARAVLSLFEKPLDVVINEING